MGKRTTNEPRSSSDPVAEAEHEVKRWQTESLKLRERLDGARSELTEVEREWHESALEARAGGGGQATATVLDLRGAVADSRAEVEELEASLQLAEAKLADARERVTAEQRAQVEQLKADGVTELERKREAAYRAIEALGQALVDMRAVALKLASYDSALTGRQPLGDALAGRIDAKVEYFDRHMQARELTRAVHEACREPLYPHWLA